MRPILSRKEVFDLGLTESQLRWAVRNGEWHCPQRGLYLYGEKPNELEAAVALSIAAGGVASHSLAAALYDLDATRLCSPFATLPLAARSKRQDVFYSDIPVAMIDRLLGIDVTNGTRTMFDLANSMNDLEWEQAMESALRKCLTTVEAIELHLLEAKGRRGVERVRRVLALRPEGAPPTESMLETLAVQLIRSDCALPTPTRQVEVFNRRGAFVARVDLAYPEHGVFLELDGQHHRDQPVYDASRQTAVVAAKGWRPARFTWHEITRAKGATRRRLREILNGS